MQLVEQTAKYIALGLVSLMMLNLPDCIVLTGGLLRSYDLLEMRIRSIVAQHNVVIPATKVRIQPSRLDQQAGMFGAVRAAQYLLMETKA